MFNKGRTLLCPGLAPAGTVRYEASDRDDPPGAAAHRAHVRFWERHGSGDTQADGLRCGDRDHTAAP
jgi:hypothetical protein